MHCLLCGKKLPFLRKLKNGDFCSAAHQEEFQHEQNQAAVARLLTAASVEKETKAKLDAKPAPVAAEKPQSKPGKASGAAKGKKGSNQADSNVPACPTFLRFTFSCIEWTGRGMQTLPAKPTRPRRRLVVPALERRANVRRVPPSVRSLMALASMETRRPAPAACASTAEADGLHPVLVFPKPEIPPEAAAWSRLESNRPDGDSIAITGENPGSGPLPSLAESEPGIAGETPWPAHWGGPADAQQAIRPLWALPVTQRLDWRPKQFPPLNVEIRSDPRTDPYAAAQHEGCGLLAISPPNPRRPHVLLSKPRVREDSRAPIEPKRAVLLPASVAVTGSALRRGRQTTVSLTEPVAGRYPWISLFPRQLDTKLRCRPPRWKQPPSLRALPRGARIEMRLPCAGTGIRVVWLTSGSLPLAPMAARVPSVRPLGPEFRHPLGTLVSLGVHPKTRSGTEVLSGDDPYDLEILPQAALRMAKLGVALHNDWLTVAAGPVRLVLSVEPRTLPLVPRGDQAATRALAPPAASNLLAPPSGLRVKSARRLGQMNRKMLPVSLDGMEPRDDTRCSCRSEGNQTNPAPPAPPRESGLGTRCEILRRSPSQRWSNGFQSLAARWQELPAPIRWSGPLMAVVAAVALLGPSGFLSSSPDFESLMGRSGTAPAVVVEEPHTPSSGRAAAKPSRASRVPEVSRQDEPVGTQVSFWDTFERKLVDRAAVALTDDFRNGLSAWNGVGNWARNWSYDAAGFVRTGPLALYAPSSGLTDYRAEFLGQIERRSLGWTLRSANLRNYYACKLTIMSGGPQPKVSLVRYRVINGVSGAVHTTELPMQVQADTVYRVLSEVRGTSFTVSVQGVIVDSWDDDRLTRGGVGFFSAPGELARIRWVGVWHQYDILGRLCAFLVPPGPKTNRSL